MARWAPTAYAIGWARSGGPLTDRVRAGARIAATLAAEHHDHPGVIEATLQLGALEGVWARIYARREALYARHDGAVSVAWHNYTTRALDVPALVTAVRRAAGLAETKGPDAVGGDEQHDRIVAATLAALLGLLQHHGDTRYGALVDAITAALVDGTAEGSAGAIALAAHKAGYSTVDFDRAFIDARKVAAGQEQAGFYATQAEQWLRRMTNAAGTLLGHRLARMVAADATPDELADEVRSSGTGRNVSPVATFTDWALGLAFTIGALTTFTVMGLSTVNWVTAGGKVCPVCVRNEASSPYPLLSAPQPPQHPHCRCSLDPAGPIDSLVTFAKYLIGG